MQLNGDFLAAYLSSYGGVECYTLITSAHRTAYGDYVLTMVLDRGGFHAIPHTITYRDTTMKQLGHFSRSCPQKTTIAAAKTTATATTDTTNAMIMTTTTATITTKTTEDPNPETGGDQNKEDGWTQVKGRKKKTPLKSPSPAKQLLPVSTTTAIAEATAATKDIIQIPVNNTAAQKKKKKTQFIPPPKDKKKRIHRKISLETFTNLKKRRDSGDSNKEGEKKQCKSSKPEQQPQPQNTETSAPSTTHVTSTFSPT